MVNKDIVFPIIELTDWVFEGEKVLFVDYSWIEDHHIKEKDFEKHYNSRVIVDSKGQILKVTGNKIIRKEWSALAFLFPPTVVVRFDLELTGRIMSIEEVKRNIISKSPDNFQITQTKRMTESEYNTKVRTAKTYEELFKIAGFVDEDEAN